MLSKRERLPLDGIFLLDKPVGITSNQALQQVKYLLKAKKAGHTGSLDPLASGVLPLCFGQATKFAKYLLGADKSYLVTAKFGATTDTGDADGEVVLRRPVPELTTEVWAQMAAKFLGPMQQVPPMYSAIKRNGVPMYKLARQGKTVELEGRAVNIQDLQLVSIGSADSRDSITFMVKCSKGTYVRSLVVDMGEYLHCGAHVTALRRLQSGPYAIEQTITLQALQQQLASCPVDQVQQLLLPVDTVFATWPRIGLLPAEETVFLHGQTALMPSVLRFVSAQNFVITTLPVVLQTSTAKVLGVAEVDSSGKINDRILLCRGLLSGGNI